MFSKQLASIVIATTAVVGLAGPAQAVEGQDDFMLFRMAMMDKNKDGMVSKKEFMAMVEKAYDNKTKASKGMMMSEAEVQAFLKSLYYIGGN